MMTVTDDIERYSYPLTTFKIKTAQLTIFLSELIGRKAFLVSILTGLKVTVNCSRLSDVSGGHSG